MAATNLIKITNASINLTQEPAQAWKRNRKSNLELVYEQMRPEGHVKECGGLDDLDIWGIADTFIGDEMKWSLKSTDAKSRGGENIFY